jgi:hypothetical protein
MHRIPFKLAILTTLLAASGACTARAATLASLIAGATLETSRLTFDQFAYTPFSGAPAAAAINLSPSDHGDGWQGVTINGTFSSTTFAQATINYRVTAKSGGVVFSASLTGNLVSGAFGASVGESFSGGLQPLSITAQGGTSSTIDSATFSTPRPSVTATSLITLSGSVPSPSSVTFLEETFRATALRADFDLDDDVDGADFRIWQQGVGKTGSNLRIQGDANSSGVVDGADLTILRSTFGPLPSPIQSVPEPCSAAIAGIGCIGAIKVFRGLRSGDRRRANSMIYCGATSTLTPIVWSPPPTNTP